MEYDKKKGIKDTKNIPGAEVSAEVSIEDNYYKKPEAQNKEKEGHKEAIYELLNPIKKIFLEISEGIDKGEYKLIIGDDASGRIPAVIFDKVLKSLYREKGYDAPKTLFFSGSMGLKSFERWQKSEDIGNYLEREGYGSKKETAIKELTTKIMNKIKKEQKSEQKSGKLKALVVTDTIASGVSLKPICLALKRNGIDFDIATIGITNEDDLAAEELRIKKFLEERGGFLGGKIFYGAVGEPLIYGQKRMSGVKKDVREIFSKPLVKAEIVSSREKEKIKESIFAARKGASDLADKILDWYRSRE